MARSIKKNNYLKDDGNFKQYIKKLSHSRIRLEVKRRLKRGDWETMPLNRELTNQWEVCDWKSYYDQDMMKRYHSFNNDNKFIIINDIIDELWYISWIPRSIWYKGRYRLIK